MTLWVRALVALPEDLNSVLSPYQPQVTLVQEIQHPLLDSAGTTHMERRDWDGGKQGF